VIADLREWLDDVAARSPATLTRPARVVGVRDAHLGPRWDRAEVEIEAEPAARWSVEVDLPGGQSLLPEQTDFLRQAVLGVLDVLTTRPPQPLLNLRLRIVGARFDPVDANARAFRLAGRDAAEKLIAAAT
jgi:hypothetical protein